jgi:NAD(P)-dependent dehydrogenase (short-subunit alcohol dehydrogenase family)
VSAQAVVTGAASGIGRALTRNLAADGYHVHLADVSPTADLAAELSATSHVVDVANAQEMEALAAPTSDVDVVCLNAGVVGQTLGAPWEVPTEEWLGLLRVNLLGVVNGLRVFVPRLLAAERPARIVVTASLAGLVTFPGGGAYAASKHALIAVAEQTALALAESPVTVTVVCPALVRTAMSNEGDDPADVAAAALTAAREGRFLVMPPEWTAAVLHRADRLASGRSPEVPVLAPLGPSQFERR